MSLELFFTRLSAFLGNKIDLYRMGTFYYEGKHVAKDLTRAKEYLRKASDKKHLKALYYLGLIELEEFAKSDDLALALRYFELSKKEEPRAKGAIEALEQRIFDLAETPESATLLFKLGYMYANDVIVGIDYDKSKRYYERAAQYGNLHAQNELGKLYLFGRRGVTKDLQRAQELLFPPMRVGFSPAKITLFKLYSEPEILADLLKSIQAKNVSPDLLNIAGLMSLEGVNLPEDRELAESLFLRAAEAKHPNALVNLAKLKQDSDKELASSLFKSAEALGHSSVMMENSQ